MSEPTRSPGDGCRGLRFLLVLGCVAAAAAGLCLPQGARSQESNFAGSIQTNYLWVPSDDEARRQTFDGFTNELSLKVAVDSDRPCLCQRQALLRLPRLRDRDGVLRSARGRSSSTSASAASCPSFGDFPLRHDPANHRTSDKPLPYDMGRMLRMREYNMGVLPSPYVDQGAEINGTHWFGEVVQLDYAAYVVGGLRADQDDADLDWIQSRSTYYVDNNSEPAVGGRIAMTLDVSDAVMFTLGGSGMAGHADPKREQEYAIVGVDLYARLDVIDLRAEYLIRRHGAAARRRSRRALPLRTGRGRRVRRLLPQGRLLRRDQPAAVHPSRAGRSLRRSAPDRQRPAQQPAPQTQHASALHGRHEHHLRRFGAPEAQRRVLRLQRLRRRHHRQRRRRGSVLSAGFRRRHVGRCRTIRRSCARHVAR